MMTVKPSSKVSVTAMSLGNTKVGEADEDSSSVHVVSDDDVDGTFVGTTLVSGAITGVFCVLIVLLPRVNCDVVLGGTFVVVAADVVVVVVVCATVVVGGCVVIMQLSSGILCGAE